MRVIDLVLHHYSRLSNEFELAKGRGAVKRSTPFYEWASGKVLFDAEVTVEAREDIASSRGGSSLIDSVYNAFMRTDELRLIPAQTFDKDRKAIIILTVQP